MNHPVLLTVVSIQVLAFQFLSLRLTRSLADYLVGYEGLPQQTAEQVERFQQHAGRLRKGIGVVLWVVALLCALLPSIDPVRSKLVLAAVSLVSSAVLTVGFVLDRRAVRRIAAGLPEPTERTASLERPALRLHYPLFWEALPLALVALTVTFTLWAASTPTATGRWELLVFPVIQAFFVFGGLLWSVQAARSGRALPQRARPFLGGGAAAARAGETLCTLELRFFLAARIGLALMFGLMQAKKAGAVADRHVPGWLDGSLWVVVLLMLALFAAFGLVASGVRRKLGKTGVG